MTLESFLNEATLNLQNYIKNSTEAVKYVNDSWKISDIPLSGKNWIIINNTSILGPYWNNKGRLVLYVDKSIPKNYTSTLYATKCGALYSKPIHGTNYVFKYREFIEVITLN